MDDVGMRSGDAARASFVERVWAHYHENGRDLPWRRTRDPYAILVSEVMLQQTQVSRVVPKYEAFLAAFPTPHALAVAPLDEVLRVWSGLGYNRRALNLRRAAEAVVVEHGGHVPDTLEGLTSLPGIGHATAAQVLAFAFDIGVPFIETNIRSVYLHEFFGDAGDVPDAAILPFVEATMPAEGAREWFWALMDYGTHLKATLPNPSRRSKHHVRQGRFEGSNRQLRGRLLVALGQAAAGDAGWPEPGSRTRSGLGRTIDQLAESVCFEPERVEAALAALQSEGFVVAEDGRWRIG
mgnify:FL=1